MSMTATAATPAGPGRDDAPRRARWVAYGLVGLLALSVVTGLEWWPLSAFRLFSRARTGTAVSWQVVLVDGAGAEHPLSFSRLPRGFRGSHQLAPTLRGLPDGDRDDVCRAWAGAAANRIGVVATEVRVYRVAGQVPTGHGRVPGPSRTLAVTCAGAGP